jgi:hypothetical protein
MIRKKVEKDVMRRVVESKGSSPGYHWGELIEREGSCIPLKQRGLACYGLMARCCFRASAD